MTDQSLAAMLRDANQEWRDCAADDWGTIDFRRWPRGYHHAAWGVAGRIACNPYDVLDHPPSPAARAVNALFTRLCLVFTIVMTRHVDDPADPDEPLLAWFEEAADEYGDDIAETIEALANFDWGLPQSRKRAARKLVRMWEACQFGAFRDFSTTFRNRPGPPWPVAT